MINILLLLGMNDKTKKNKPVYIRKRIFHRGYQISAITFGRTEHEDMYSLIVELDTFNDVKEWLLKN